MPRNQRATGLSTALRPARVQAAALEVLADVLQEGQLADRALSRVLRRERELWSAERRAAAEAVYGVLRHETALRAALSRNLGPGGLEQFPASAVHAALLLGHLQLEGQMADPGALASPLRGALGSLSSALAACIAEAAERSPAAKLALEHSLPEWLASTLAEEIGIADTERLFGALNQRAPLTLRTNGLRTSREGLLQELSAAGLPASPTRLSPWGIALGGNPNLFGLPPFREGRFEVQDEGSQLLALMCRARPGQIVVDACAGGGGKTLALAAEMHNRGEIWALDVNARRLAELKPRARRDGVHNVRSAVIPEDGPEPRAVEQLRGRADVVLVDAPCSGLGALRRNPDARRRLQPEAIGAHAARQLAILGRMAPLVRPGGLLVYATCSVLRAENEEIAEAFTAANPVFAPQSPAALLGEALAAAVDAALPPTPGLRSANALRLWPQHHGTDGFFAIGLRRA